MKHHDTIVALSTATGGAINVIRLSGSEALTFAQSYLKTKIAEPRKAYFSAFLDKEDKLIDEVVALWFAAPNSYTGEDVIEISCHGSKWVTSEIIRLLIATGARSATAGEFTQRAFLNGKMNLSQAEAVGDLIASESRLSTQIALSQMRGGYSTELQALRERLLNIKSLLELELDFGDEDVEFASRDDLRRLLEELGKRCELLSDSFLAGNVIRNGVPVAIVGAPNVGKSTLLNLLLGDERAIVSDIAGTTRDYIEDRVHIDGIEFRFIDTAGIRHTDDKIEAIGVERSREMISKAKVILHLVDNNNFEHFEINQDQTLILVNSKADKVTVAGCDLAISCHTGEGISELHTRLIASSGISGVDFTSGIIVSNQRHYELLMKVNASVQESLEMLARNATGDLLSYSLTSALDHLGEITGEYTTDEVLGNIFSNFCIGK